MAGGLGRDLPLGGGRLADQVRQPDLERLRQRQREGQPRLPGEAALQPRHVGDLHPRTARQLPERQRPPLAQRADAGAEVGPVERLGRTAVAHETVSGSGLERVDDRLDTTHTLTIGHIFGTGARPGPPHGGNADRGV
jgi:hypothetical protein